MAFQGNVDSEHPSLAKPPERKSGRSHVEALDGLRGIAAIAVMLGHANVGNSHSFLAVDFFFCLSGFVIGMAYENRLRQGLGVRRYMVWRWLRVYPMLLLGLLFGLLLWRLNPEAAELASFAQAAFAMSAITHAGFIPFFGQSVAFPLNNVQWSILYELLANLIHALLVKILSNRLLFILIALSGAHLAIRALMVGSLNWGFDTRNIDIAVVRTLFSFFTGLALFRFRERIVSIMPRIGFWWLALALLLPASVHSIERPFAWLEPMRQLVTVMAFNPIIIALALNSGGKGMIVRWLGALSFPLYAVHLPLVYGAYTILSATYSGFMLKGVMLLACGPVVVLALLLGLYVDLPLNRLRRRIFE